MTTLLIAEHDNASIKDATNKTLTAAIALGGDVHVLVAGENAKAAAEAVASQLRDPIRVWSLQEIHARKGAEPELSAGAVATKAG